MSMQRINFTPLPNIVFDKWLSELTPAEFKVFIAICRKTYGWHKEQDKISLSQLVQMTNLSKKGIINSLDKLIGYDLITKVKQSLKNKGDAPNLYSISLQEEELSTYPPSELSTLPPVKSVHTQKKLLTKERNTITVQNTKQCSKQPLEVSYSVEQQKFINITPGDLEQWKIAYPSANISQEIAKATEWLRSEPTKAKQKKKFRRFITNWLAKADERKFNQSSYKQISASSYQDKKKLSDDNRKFLQRFAHYLVSTTNDPVKANGIKLLDYCFIDKAKGITINYALPMIEIEEILRLKYNVNLKK